MAKVLLCKDGIMVELESDPGLWIVLRDPEQESELGRFAIDASELLATLQGNVSFQATDGLGSSVTFEGSSDSLKIRLEGQGYAPKLCRLDGTTVKTALADLRLGV